MKENSIFWLVALLCVFLAISALLQLHFESKKTEEKVSVVQLSDFYFKNYPLQREHTLGRGPIHIIAFFDPLSDSSEFFAKIDDLIQNYVTTNRATLLINPIVLAGQDNTKAKQFLCLQQNRSSIDLYRNLKDNLPNDPPCQTEITDRIAESEYLGLHGLNARLYIGLGDDYELVEGIASAQQIERAVRLKEIAIGK